MITSQPSIVEAFSVTGNCRIFKEDSYPTWIIFRLVDLRLPDDEASPTISLNVTDRRNLEKVKVTTPADDALTDIEDTGIPCDEDDPSMRPDHVVDEDILSSGVLTAMILGEEDTARVGAGADAGADADAVKEER